MSYQSVDQIQKALTESVFHYAKDSKKAAGRALGTIVEIITFYALKSWGLERNIAIEKPLPEFGNDDITHNVEYSLHPSTHLTKVAFEANQLPITAVKMAKNQSLIRHQISKNTIKSHALLSKNLILRNSCTIYDGFEIFVNAYLDSYTKDGGQYSIVSLRRRPFAIFECKRVGVEEGMRKGPQTIEKAKQGAYVARTVSSLQKIRLIDGSMGGLIQKQNGAFRHGDYYELMAEIIASNDKELLSRFILTVGVVSNHGNWFTSENHNKELKVLAQSYDWLLFLTDAGIAQFIEELLLNPTNELLMVKEAFQISYTGEKGVNQFTKVKILLSADIALQSYFNTNKKNIEAWFNVIAPAGKRLVVLSEELNTLKSKKWW
ncbi:hypothetical protein [Candidatus Magnetominusculus xianensis]|uniref:Uncharacterized protein n=1 Tax=Candidatus Magnetominusculus xianensis TaxID=1748249 RepID=A0ABR5SI55_9BACT|nr:hypothetical protein [Candidatus Magnetominusculus xianensis]KWT92019.1 hypothetical protein ASN18_0627 [Candidatus Magnetominusculus xianensis]MBF0405247.1 hypothetical protein [Nitrospirota bacterium]